MTIKSQILIVEDNAIAALVLGNHCQKAGFAVDHAPGVKVASEHLLQSCYRLILMDLGLQDGDGKTLTQWIRREANPNQNTPIIIVSAHMDNALKIACLEAGANDAFVKPVIGIAMANLLKELQ